MTFELPKPTPFLVVREHHTNIDPTLCGLCVGYERSEWRMNAFAKHIMKWLPEFSLTLSECRAMNHANSMEFISEAARKIYKSKKYQKRGEFGELFLHAAIRQVHDSLPAISKIYFKTAENDTVKGFDAVHVVGSPEDMELWLGEVKFYEDVKQAARDVIQELEDHLQTDYLRSEFMLISGKLDEDLPHAEKLKLLLHENTSLDDVFARTCIPVLLTYDSACIESHKSCSPEYSEAFRKELQESYDYFLEKLKAKGISSEIQIHLFLIPLENKKALVTELDEKLKIWQTL